MGIASRFFFNFSAQSSNVTAMWLFLKEFIRGMVSIFHITSSSLYRYPYRNGAEAFKGDWARIGKDLHYVLESMKNEQGR